MELIHDWYNKGYIYKDATTTDEVNYDTVKNNVCFSFFYAAENATKNSGLAGCGYDMTVVKVYDTPITTSYCEYDYMDYSCQQPGTGSGYEIYESDVF